MVNILRLSVAYLSATINGKPETQNQRLEPTGLPKRGGTRELMGTGPGLGRQESAGRVISRVWDWINLFLQSKPVLLAGYPDLVLTLTLLSLRKMWEYPELLWSTNDIYYSIYNVLQVVSWLVYILLIWDYNINQKNEI